jgi:hypothetical protein
MKNSYPFFSDIKKFSNFALSAIAKVTKKQPHPALS